MKKVLIFLFCFGFFLTLGAGDVFAADDLIVKQSQLSQLNDQLTSIQSQMNAADIEFRRLSDAFEQAKRESNDKRENCNRAKEAYDRASQNADIVAPDQIARLAKAYQDTNNELRLANDQLARAENERKLAEEKLSRLKEEYNRKNLEILEVQADIYDIQLRAPAWVEGTGEAILDENSTMKSCRDLALKYAKQDAVERGGKAIIEAFSQVEMFKLVKDQIKVSSKVQVIEEDTSGDYGKVQKVMVGDMTKFVAKVRIKVQSIDTYNPYREKLAALKGTYVPPTNIINNTINPIVPVIDQKPLEITNIRLRNEHDFSHVISGFTNRFEKDALRYLCYHLNLKNNTDEDLEGDIYIKYINPDGSLHKSSSSPDGFTTTQHVKVPARGTTTTNSGWGISTKGNYEVGTNTIEFYWNGSLIGTTTFDVYEDTDMPLKITQVKLRNQDYDNNGLSEFKTKFTKSEIQYICYHLKLKNNTSQQLSGHLYVKYLKPDGNITRNTETSPAGFTLKQEVNIGPYATLDKSWGWGNRNGGTFAPGNHLIEFWWDGQMIGSAEFKVTG